MREVLAAHICPDGSFLKTHLKPGVMCQESQRFYSEMGGGDRRVPISSRTSYPARAAADNKETLSQKRWNSRKMPKVVLTFTHAPCVCARTHTHMHMRTHTYAKKEHVI